MAGTATQSSEDQPQDEATSECTGALIKCLALFVVAVAIEVVNYLVQDGNVKNDPTWSANILTNENCSEEDVMDHGFEQGSVVDSGLIGLGFGAYLGLLSYAKWDYNELKKKPQGLTFCKNFGRMILACVVCGVVGGLLHFMIGNLGSSLWFAALMKTYIPSMFVGWYVFWPHDKLSISCRLLDMKGSQETSPLLNHHQRNGEGQ